MSRADYLIDKLDSVNEKHGKKALAALAGGGATLGALHLAHKLGHEPGSGGGGGKETAKEAAKGFGKKLVHPDTQAGKVTHAAHSGGRAHGGRMTSPRASGAETEHTIKRGSMKVGDQPTKHHIKTTSDTPTHQKARELSKHGLKDPNAPKTYTAKDMAAAHRRGQAHALGGRSKSGVFKGDTHPRDFKPIQKDYVRKPKKLIHKLTGLSPGGEFRGKGPIRDKTDSGIPHFLKGVGGKKK